MKPSPGPKAWAAAACAAFALDAASAGAADPAADCPSGAIVCVVAASTSAQPQTQVPITFGQAFAPGEVPRGVDLAALTLDRKPAPPNLTLLQVDQPARHPDGSLRFAVLSLLIPRIEPGSAVTIGLTKAPQKLPSPVALTAENTIALARDLQVSVTLHTTDVWLIKLGDFKGHAAGVPFLAGERLTIRLGDDPRDVLSLDVTPALAGGTFDTCTKLVEALAARITATGRFKAIRPTDTYGEIRVSALGPPRALNLAISHDGRGKTEAVKIEAHQPSRALVARLPATTSAVKTWLSGPITTETISSLEFFDTAGKAAEPKLAARIALRAHREISAITADVILENDDAFAANPRRLTYDIKIEKEGRTLFSATGVEQAPRTRWRKRVWLAGEPAVTLRRDVTHLISTGAIPPYDLRARPSEALRRQNQKLAASDAFAPMGSGGVTLYMPMTGGRPDIGLLPRWAAAYLIGSAPLDLALTLGAAEGGGSAPIHYRDRATDLPVSIDRHPTASLRPSQSLPADRIPEAAPGDSPWTVDSAHQPSLAYVPYLLTGDAYYLDELHFWANWNLLVPNPDYRGRDAGLIWDNQLRGQAWSLRALGEAAWATPDDHPLKGYFNAKLTNNLAWYAKATAPGAPWSASLHWLKAPDKPDEVSPWQNDMMAVVLAQLSRMGWRQADGVLAWMADFVVGRWNAEADGFCPANAPGYWWKTRSEREGRDFKDWRTFNQFNFPKPATCAPLTTMDDRHVTLAYPALARAALAMMANRGIPKARETFDRLDAVMTAKWADDPTWAFQP